MVGHTWQQLIWLLALDKVDSSHAWGTLWQQWGSTVYPIIEWSGWNFSTRNQHIKYQFGWHEAILAFIHYGFYDRSLISFKLKLGYFSHDFLWFTLANVFSVFQLTVRYLQSPIMDKSLKACLTIEASKPCIHMLSGATLPVKESAVTYPLIVSMQVSQAKILIHVY